MRINDESMVQLLLMLRAIALPFPRRTVPRRGSMVISDRGIVATSQTLASQAGAQVLARGGSAMDAAIAANAVLGVVEPESCGIGGDLFAIYWDAKTGKLSAINASGWAPSGLTIDVPQTKGATAMPQEGIHSVTVPGASMAGRNCTRASASCRGATCFSRPFISPSTAIPVTEMIGGAWKIGEAKLAKRSNAPARFSAGTARRPRSARCSAIREMAAALQADRRRRAPRRFTAARSPRPF